MTAHELAKALLAGPDLPVTISDDCGTFEVAGVSDAGSYEFNGANDTSETPRDKMGYNLPRPCLELLPCEHTPPSEKQLDEERKRHERMEQDRKRLTPEAFAFRYASITGLSPSDIEALGKSEATAPSAPPPPAAVASPSAAPDSPTASAD